MTIRLAFGGPSTRPHVLYICIPTFDEAPTIGVLLWKIRKVFQEYSREYEILVYNDASTDATAETLEPYRKVLPLTVLGGERRVGYAGALTALCRDASQRTRYARRDAVITLQGDFTDQPEHIPELVKRFEGGADVVVAESADAAESPKAVRRLRRFAPWALRWSVKASRVKDPFGSLRLYRVSVLRDALRAAGDAPFISGEGWAANVDLLLATIPHARRTETVTMEPRYDLRPRDTRVRPLADVMNSVSRFGREARHRVPPVAPPTPTS
ncbi:MAG: glycosyltransferase family 2 protein [Gemmatimonadetes bacterium]|nr:glycosyltransferase family 2 protein [Gemmatimonadota bacterium]